MLSYLALAVAVSVGQGSPNVSLMAPLDTAPVEFSVSVEQGKAAEPLAPPIKPGPTPVPVAPDDSKKPNGTNGSDTPKVQRGFAGTIIHSYIEMFGQTEPVYRKDWPKDDKTEPAPRRSPPEPWSSPPFPVHEYQGYPLIGTPASNLDDYPLMKGILASPFGDWFKENKIKFYGWVTAEGNFSNANNSNTPTSYWIVPNRLEMDQLVFRAEREFDSVQTDHIDWGFRSTHVYGIDYRYTTAGGWFSYQLLKHNSLYGYDPIEQYFDLYIPWVAEGMVIRFGRWVACPDIETQLAPDNYLGSHSLLFTYDTYTQTGIMFTFKLTDQWMVQGGLTSGTDMAPWYAGAIPTGYAAVRWVSRENNDAMYTVLNNINDGQFRHFDYNGLPAGHDNFNYVVTTWEHRFDERFHTKTEAYFMWQFNANVGGTPSIGPVESYGGGGGLGAPIPGTSIDYGILNYTMYALSKRDYVTLRNEWWEDPQGERTGFRTCYSSHTIGWSHQLNDVLMVRPELGYYHSYDVPAFDNGLKRNLVMLGFDVTLRF